MMRYITLLLIAAWMLILSACEKFVDLPVSGTETSRENMFSSDIMANSAVLAIYSKMIGENGFASGSTMSVSFVGGLSADELETHTIVNTIREFYNNSISADNSLVENGLWNKAYTCIYAANSVIEGLRLYKGVSDSTKAQLLSEAFFIRAFSHFYLVNLFGDVPYVTVTDFRVNDAVSRIPQWQVYQHIALDLDTARSLSQHNVYIDERIRPNRWAATALLARVYLYNQQWAQAAAMADSLISHNDIYAIADSLNDVFLANSREAIWQLKPNKPDINTWEGNILILTGAPGIAEDNSTVLSPYLLQAFEPGDRRKSHWIDSISAAGANTWYFPYKYKIKTGDSPKEYSMVFRLAEQYLIRAEARAQLGDITGAKADLNVIRARAGLPPVQVSSPDELLSAIAHERQIELFSEWGHRWFDLKRSGQSDKILSSIKPLYWQPTDTLYPIPRNEITLNPRLTQNAGYN